MRKFADWEKPDPPCVDLHKLYGKKYRVELEPAWDKDENKDWYWVIYCRKGEIYPIGGNDIGVWINVKANLKTIQDAVPDHVIWQNSDVETVLRMDVKHTDMVAKLLGARKRRILSPEHKAKLIASSAHVRFAKNTVLSASKGRQG